MCMCMTTASAVYSPGSSPAIGPGFCATSWEPISLQIYMHCTSGLAHGVAPLKSKLQLTLLPSTRTLFSTAPIVLSRQQ